MATELLFSDLKAWLDAQPENTARTPYDIIIKDAPSKGYSGTITRFVYIMGMEMKTGVTSIGNYAFNECSKLLSITIPEGVTSIGERAFAGCTNLSSVYMAPAFSETLMKSNSFTGTPSDLKLYVSLENLSGWQSATLTNYGFSSSATVEVLSTKKWVQLHNSPAATNTVWQTARIQSKGFH